MDRRDDDQRKRGVAGRTIDAANNLANKARQIKAWINRIQAAIKVAQAVAAAIASAPAWPFIAAGVVIIVLVLVILLGGGGDGGTPGLASNDTPPVGGGPGPGGGGLASCPVQGGIIWTGSYQADPVNGHCSDNYGACDHNSRRAKSIDVRTGGPSGENVVLPSLEGKTQDWIYVNRLPNFLSDCTDPADGTCGSTMIFMVNLGDGKNWTLHLVHMGGSSFVLGKVYPSGTVVGKTSATHVHISLGKDISNPLLPPRGGTDTEAGWLAVDADAGMCVISSNTASNVCTQQYEGTGYCSSSDLMQYFGNPTEALVASLICSAESGSDPLSLNDNCATNDYSVGLYQINAVAHCPGAYGDLSCHNLLSVQKRNVCENNWYDPVQNISKAKSIREEWGSWRPWGTWAGAGRIPAVKDILTKCGITY